MTYGEVPDDVKNHPGIKDLPPEQKQFVWDLANDLCINYLIAGNCDPVVNLFSKMQPSSHLLDELYGADVDKDLFKKYYDTPDLNAFKEMIIQIKKYDKTAGSPECKALVNMWIYLMNQMATDPWWFSRVGFWNRYMGSRMRDESYVAIRFNLAFTPNHFFNVHNHTEAERNKVNLNTRPIEEVYGWVEPEEVDGQ